jgi:hypothetical protein
MPSFDKGGCFRQACCGTFRREGSGGRGGGRGCLGVKASSTSAWGGGGLGVVVERFGCDGFCDLSWVSLLSF